MIDKHHYETLFWEFDEIESTQDQLFLLQSRLWLFKFLVSNLTLNHEFQMTALAQRWEWTWGATEKDYDETDVEEDEMTWHDMTEQAPVPPCKVDHWLSQTGVPMTATQMTVLIMSSFQSHVHPKVCQTGNIWVNKQQYICIHWWCDW